MTDSVPVGPKPSSPAGAGGKPSEAARDAAARVIERCDLLAACSETSGAITRTFGSAAMRQAHELVSAWMNLAVLDVRLDPATNLIGRYEFADARTAKRPALVIGSHLDTVSNAGRYDGALGVLMGIALVEMLRAAGAVLPFAIEVCGFCEEEGVRFGTPYIGSRALVGALSDEYLQTRDAAGITIAEAIGAFGGNPARLSDAVRPPAEIVAYIEPHIEQGPVLEREGISVGAVTGFAGQTRARLRFTGQAGHAGTVPMAVRRDALAAAAALIVEIERRATTDSAVVATVGLLDVAPNVPNVIPGSVTMSLDVRSLEDASRSGLFQQIVAAGRAIADRRRIEFDVTWSEDHPASHCDARLTAALRAAIADCGMPEFEMASGAGHDAVMLGHRFPTAMLFMRCRGGISHHPDEAVTSHDVAVALDVLQRFVERVAAKPFD